MKKILLIASSVFAALAANATPVNVSGANGEQTLVNIVNGTTIDIAGGQLASDSYFTAPSLSANMVIEIAGNSPGNAFGIYNQFDSSQTLEIFAGSAAAGASTALINLPLGWTSFGFYLSNVSAGYTWYSDADLNANGKLDHFVTYAGIAGETMTASGITFGSNDYLVAVEDLNLGDWDYNDMVVKVHLTPKVTTHGSVPDSGATAALMGLGLCALAALRRRK